jgi:hypothetical protein
VWKTSLTKYMPPYLYFSLLLFFITTFGTLRQLIPFSGFWRYLSEVLFCFFVWLFFVLFFLCIRISVNLSDSFV